MSEMSLFEKEWRAAEAQLKLERARTHRVELLASELAQAVDSVDWPKDGPAGRALIKLHEYFWEEEQRIKEIVSAFGYGEEDF